MREKPTRPRATAHKRRVAIVHDSLVELGGAERMLRSLLTIFPEAIVYTAYYDASFVREFFPALEEKIHSTRAQNTILARHYSLFQLLSPLLWRQFDFHNYDLVISNSSYVLGNLVRTRGVPHIQYIQCPPKNLFGLDQPSRLQRVLPYTSLLAGLYKRAVRASPYVITNSQHIQRTIFRLCGAKSVVIYPPVNIPRRAPTRKHQQYYITVSRIDRIKNLEISIQACTRLQLPLVVVGKTNDPPYERYLRNIAGPTVRFLGFKSDREISELYQSAIAFLFTAKSEDFGIVPVEAMAHGVPVIAFFGGGVKETILPNKTGMFFYRHTADDLIKTLLSFRSDLFNPNLLYEHTKQYSEAHFHGRMKEYAHEVLDIGKYKSIIDR